MSRDRSARSLIKTLANIMDVSEASDPPYVAPKMPQPRRKSKARSKRKSSVIESPRTLLKQVHKEKISRKSSVLGQDIFGKKHKIIKLDKSSDQESHSSSETSDWEKEVLESSESGKKGTHSRKLSSSPKHKAKPAAVEPELSSSSEGEFDEVSGNQNLGNQLASKYSVSSASAKQQVMDKRHESQSKVLETSHKFKVQKNLSFSKEFASPTNAAFSGREQSLSKSTAVARKIPGIRSPKSRSLNVSKRNSLMKGRNFTHLTDYTESFVTLSGSDGSEMSLGAEAATFSFSARNKSSTSHHKTPEKRQTPTKSIANAVSLEVPGSPVHDSVNKLSSSSKSLSGKSKLSAERMDSQRKVRDISGQNLLSPHKSHSHQVSLADNREKSRSHGHTYNVEQEALGTSAIHSQQGQMEDDNKYSIEEEEEDALILDTSPRKLSKRNTFSKMHSTPCAKPANIMNYREVDLSSVRGSDSTHETAPSPNVIMNEVEVDEAAGVDQEHIEPSTSKTKSSEAHVRRKKKSASERPHMPNAMSRDILQHFAQMPVARSSMPLINECLERFFDQTMDTLTAYAKHAGRNQIDIPDVELLMFRLRMCTDRHSLNALIEEHLSRELREELIPVAQSVLAEK